jgi:hypothetical protein
MRYFVVQSVGFSGSAFLSKVLNSHKDVISFHEVELRNSVSVADDKSYRVRLFFELEEHERMLGHFYYISNIADVTKYFKMYRAVGTVETRHFNFEFPEKSIPEIYERIQSVAPDSERIDIKFAYLIRSPVKITNSLYSEFEKILFLLFSNRNQNPEIANKLKKFELYLNDSLLYAIRFLQDNKVIENIVNKQDLLLRVFGVCSMIVFAFFKYISLKDESSILILEKITSSKEEFEKKAKEITGEDYEIDEEILSQKVNVHQGKDDDRSIFDSWSKEKKAIFSLVFSNIKEELKRFGYGDVVNLL